MRVWTGRDTLLALLGTFGVIFAVNGYFIERAIRTYPGEDVRHPYLQGADFNETLRERATQSKLGWRVSIAAARTKDSAVEVQVRLAQRDGAAVAGEALNGLLRHPMNEQLDRTFALRETAPGLYTGRIHGVHAGAWDVIVSRSKASEAPFTAERRVFLP